MSTDLNAPRITRDEVLANIRSEFYFTAADGVLGESQLGTAAASHTGLKQITFCVLVLSNKTKVVGINYGAIDPQQHDPVKGREAAKEHAIEQIWPLMGYQLRTAVQAFRESQQFLTTER